MNLFAFLYVWIFSESSSSINISQANDSTPTKLIGSGFEGTIALYNETSNILNISGGIIESTDTNLYRSSIYFSEENATNMVRISGDVTIRGNIRAINIVPAFPNCKVKGSTENADGTDASTIDRGSLTADTIKAYKYLKFTKLTQETTPTATFNAIGYDNGTLRVSVSGNYKYSIDSGSNWVDFTGDTADITSGITTTNGIKVVKKGDNSTTSDSEEQTITVTQATAPTGIGSTNCTTSANNDGAITGVSSDMEYKLSTDTTWRPIEASNTKVVGLEPGTYYVRVKANGSKLASTNANITSTHFRKLRQPKRILMWTYHP